MARVKIQVGPSANSALISYLHSVYDCLGQLALASKRIILVIISIDAVIRKHPDCGIIVTGDFNQLNDNFLKTHYRFVQIVNVGTRGNAVLDKIWTNMDKVYICPRLQFLNLEHRIIAWYC